MTEEEHEGINKELIGTSWQELVKDVNNSKSYIQLQQLLTRQVRNEELRIQLRTCIDGLFFKENGKRLFSKTDAKELLEKFFYPQILESFSKSIDELNPMQQLGLRVSANSTTIDPPIDDILGTIYAD